MIGECKEKLENIKLQIEETYEIYEQYRSKCAEVHKTLEEYEISFEDLKKLDPVISKFALMACLVAPKLATITSATSAGTHGVITAAHASHCLGHLKLLGKAIIPGVTISKAFLTFGVTLTGIGIVLDLVVCGTAFYKLVKGSKCSESEKISEGIMKAEELKSNINTLLYVINHSGKDLLEKAIEASSTIKQQLKDQKDTIKQLKTENEALQRQQDQQHTDIITIEKLKRENEALKRLQDQKVTMEQLKRENETLKRQLQRK